MYGAFTLSGWLSQNHSTRLTRQSCSPNPGVHALRFGLFRVRSPLLTESHVVFSSSGYLDVSVHRVPFHSLWIGLWILEVFSSRFPHSDISGSMDICSSPKLFAAYHVFHRLLVPRHPPYALISITNRCRKRCGSSDCSQRNACIHLEPSEVLQSFAKQRIAKQAKLVS